MEENNQTTQTTQTTQKNTLAMPIAVVIAGALIAGAVIYSSGKAPAAGTANQPQQQQVAAQTGDLEQMTPVTSKDHIRGDINAPVKIVEYSDTECPFCKRFHTTMKEVMDE